MGGGNDLATIVSDPARYKAEVERLTALREDAESKLRAVANEAEAEAYKAAAVKEMEAAKNVHSDAIVKANEIERQAKAAHEATLQNAKDGAASITSEAMAVLRDAELKRKEAVDLKQQVSQSIDAANSAKNQHDISAAAHEEAKKKHNIAAQLHDESRKLLEEVMKTIHEALKK